MQKSLNKHQPQRAYCLTTSPSVEDTWLGVATRRTGTVRPSTSHDLLSGSAEEAELDRLEGAADVPSGVVIAFVVIAVVVFCFGFVLGATLL